MKRNTRNTKLLENIAEISHMLMSSNQFRTSFYNGDEVDSVTVRFEAIDAALAFDRAESRLLRTHETMNYDWMLATECFVKLVIDGDSDLSPRNLEKMAEKAILDNIG